MLTNDIMDDIQELQSLLATVKSPRLAADLTALLRAKEMDLAKTQAQAPVATPAPTPTVYAPPRIAETEVYTEVSTFGWEDEGYGKPKVMVYITSGIDGVGELPASQVTCDFTKHSFDLKIKQLRGKNYRLVRYHLDKEIDPKKSKFLFKKNRVTITLWKADEKNTWSNLTAKNPGAASAAKANPSDPSAGIMDMMKNMYDEGDEEMKRTIAKAWTESRNKTAAGGL
ncbi:hypothetical protein SDRG_02765 [Saprolegnia diclina VS20]|uniref:Calcyclin-binding protein n=1 Tax=Saprolegnia diclina (strain VS20) TaxID=1156394 RepID=T0SBH4_SAPDV|nr:hypothetical protein SDRG_02765 [Saprolegnia diclina VS20]EQC40112.1 hypothetical protein SDRG_02765 [Saprolegnia diclina VS20]|eukprot:XP_008606586.1 hypothetical protein SDRG_02765 [Saprolegnia diclina VS20]